MKIIAGVDEAGRGCVLGPLCIGLVAFESENLIEKFSVLGVRDSKKLSPEKREHLYSFIKKDCFTSFSKLSVNEIDTYNLNDLEFFNMSRLSDSFIKMFLSKNSYDMFYNIDLNFDIYVDCPESDYIAYSKKFMQKLSHHRNIRVIGEHKADDKYVVVGAASIIAKVLRDNEMQLIKDKYFNEYGDIGSGYPSDAKTVTFLKNYYKNNKKFPEETRMKWGTIEKIRRNTVANT